MKKVGRFGDLNLGAEALPRVVGTISSKESLLDFPRHESFPCDLVEIRLDETDLDSFDWLGSCKAIEQLDYPTIVTLRLASEGGKWTQSDESRIPLFQQALENLSIVDVEYESKIVKQVSEIARNSRGSLLVSFHDFEKTPSFDELFAVVTEAQKYADAVKISTMVNESKDVETLKNVLDKKWEVPLCVIGMGSKGTHTRTSFPTMGSCLAYGYLDVPSAPGQLPASRLVDHFRSVLPPYNQDYIIRKQILEYA